MSTLNVISLAGIIVIACALNGNVNGAKASFEWVCTRTHVPEGVRLGHPFRSGYVYRVSFDECKKKFGVVGKAFTYYGGSKHCQEVFGYYDGFTDGNQDWQTCIAIGGDYYVGKIGGVCKDEKEVIRRQAECTNALIVTGQPSSWVYWHGVRNSLPSGCSVRAGGDLKPHFESSSTGVGRGRADLIPICKQLGNYYSKSGCPKSCKNCKNGGSGGGKPVNSDGVCEYFCSPKGYCGTGNAYKRGDDCSSCKSEKKKYILGAKGVDACPKGYKAIKDKKTCKKASKKLGLKYAKAHNVDKPNSVCNWCGGCPTQITRVSNNHGAGAKWICKKD